MIVKNEEKVITRCLESIKDIVDEIIIVDTGSTDHTKAVVQRYTNKVFNFKWIDNFSIARNYAYSKATMDYILWLDADDVVLETDRMMLRQLKQDLDPSIDVVMMKYNVGFDEQGHTTLSYFRERLTKRANNYQWHEPVHEYLAIDGKIINSDICITHQKEYNSSPDRNLSIYEKVLSREGPLSTRGHYYYARELYYHERYDDAIIYFNRFLDSETGWIEDKICACYHLSLCYQYKNQKENMLQTLLRSFSYDEPRAEICCLLGSTAMEDANYHKAILWHQLATQVQKPQHTWGFMLHDYWGYIPNLQLCLCFYKLGKIKEAIYYNNKAAEYKPEDSAVVQNKRYFSSLTKRDIN
ncbi:tetratricopeptide repeat-containing glycosyltransferase family 2 protein [Alkaliphilus metalliredigens]|nr:glycosyltransferase family 2 protein [Alkaliphilus metalliredigens]